jgi:hypothetical protein
MKEIQLTQGFKVLVDDEDFDYISQWNWCVTKNGYAKRAIMKGGVNQTFYMHRELIKPPKGVGVDHINMNKLDNRKSNLRIATASQNGANSKGRKNRVGVKGVKLDKRTGNFIARITFQKKQIHLGVFNTSEEARHAYGAKARELFGAFACT